MQPIPDDILKQFNAVLEQKSISASLWDDYRKWLKEIVSLKTIFPFTFPRETSFLLMTGIIAGNVGMSYTGGTVGAILMD